MKKIIIVVIFLFDFSIVPIQATYNAQDSLRVFLEYIHEDSFTISKILESPKANMPLETIETYLAFDMRLRFDSIQQQTKWFSGLDDSVFVTRCAQYLKHLIINDTALHLIKRCMLQAYTINHLKGYGEPIFLECAEESIALFHARDAIALPQIYYNLHTEINDRLKHLQFYNMMEIIFFPNSKAFSFSERTNEKINRILAEPNEESPFFMQFWTQLNGYSEIELARITKCQTEDMLTILLNGVENGEIKSQMTYAFMLITGLFVEKNEELGNEMLFELLAM